MVYDKANYLFHFMQEKALTSEQSTKLSWILRLAMAGEFFGHGVFAWQLKARFVEMLTAMTGIQGETAKTLIHYVGAVDMLVAVLILLKPMRILLVWGTVWALLTALARPVAGDPIWDFVERFANIGVPLALLYIRGWPKTTKEWFS